MNTETDNGQQVRSNDLLGVARGTDMRCCIACKHFYFYSGSPGHSSLTPGSNASMECMKKHFEGGDYDFDLPKVALNMAPKCRDYELSDDAIKAGWIL